MYGTVANFLKDKIQDGASLSFVSAYFTIYAFDKPKDELASIKELRFLFGEPSFINIDPEKTESKAFQLTESGLKLQNYLPQKEVARACADWIEEKAEIRSVRKSNFLHGKMYYIENGSSEDAIIGSSNFTVRGLGLSKKASHIELNLEVDSKSDCADLKAWFNNLWESDQVVDVTTEVLQNLANAYQDKDPEFIYYKTLYHRDSYLAGIKYGQYDLEKLIESCLISNRAETPLAISSKGIYTFEQLLLARYHMTQ